MDINELIAIVKKKLTDQIDIEDLKVQEIVKQIAQ